MISPLPDSDAALPVSPSRLFEATTACSGWLSCSNPSGECRYRHVTSFLIILYRRSARFMPLLVSPVTTNIPDTPKFPSPRSSAVMDRILAEDEDLALDGSPAFPNLPLLLLPIPTHVFCLRSLLWAPRQACRLTCPREGPLSPGTSVSGGSPPCLG